MSFQTKLPVRIGIILFASSSALSLILLRHSNRKRISSLFGYFNYFISSSSASASSSTSLDSATSAVKFWEKKDGEHEYLEEVLGDKALKWVREKNSEAVQILGDPNKSELYDKVLNILDSEDKIPFVARIGDLYYNFWQDAQNQKGIFRRTTLMSFKSNDVKWETVLDIDALGTSEGENWVWKGYTLYEPDDTDIPPSKALIKLSRGGADATVVREFDLNTKEFISDADNGFNLPEAKSRVAWKDENLLLIGTDFGESNSLTDSGYPRTVREWKRGTSWKDAREVFAGDAKDVAVTGYISKHRNFKVEVRHRSLTFFTSKVSVKINDLDWQDLDIPEDAQVSQFADQMIVTLRKAWTIEGKEYPGGSLLAFGWLDFITNKTKAKVVVLFTPSERTSMDYFTNTKNYLLIHTMENVRSRLHFWKYDKTMTWVYEGTEKESVIRGGSVSPVDSNANDYYWFTTSTFTKPSTLALANAALGPSGVSQAKPLKALPPQYNAANLVETQGEAISKDGTKIPYFMIGKKDLVLDGENPVLLYSYGGFQISLPPFYLGVVGKGWLEGGGVYVMANIRGGGEFGPSWHQAALKSNRNKAYEDFIAVAEDLISKRITRAGRLGIRGGSNGGLLVGNAMVMRPDLWGAVCCAVPLLDMKRFHKLLAGASWMAEYGNPDTTDWDEYLHKYSPYHNIDSNGIAKYPPLLMTTSTRDDRVHPYHARAFVKRLEDLGSKNVFYFENIEGGHGGAADNKQAAYVTAMYLDFLWSTIGKGKK